MVEEMRVQEEQEKESQDLSDSLQQGKFSLQMTISFGTFQLSLSISILFIFLSNRILILLWCSCTHLKDY